jgi:hypothetical protein
LSNGGHGLGGVAGSGGPTLRDHMTPAQSRYRSFHHRWFKGRIHRVVKVAGSNHGHPIHLHQPLLLHLLPGLVLSIPCQSPRPVSTLREKKKRWRRTFLVPRTAFRNQN